MTLENIELLARPIMHMSLWGVAPREIMGDYAFKKIKKQVQEEAKNHCMICDRFVPHNLETRDWINTHEVYAINKELKEYRLERFVGICTQCHEYIHQGRLGIMYSQGLVEEEYYDAVIKNGDHLLSLVKLQKEDNDDLTDAYHLNYEGYNYINDLMEQSVLLHDNEGYRILPRDKGTKLLPEDYYYKRPKKQRKASAK